MAIITLADSAGYEPPEPFAGPNHPIRLITRQIALDRLWDAEVRERIAETFDRLAPSWSEDHVNPTKAAPIVDAMTRGQLPLAGSRWLELGSGTGAGGKVLGGQVGEYVAFDLSAEMIRHDQGHGTQQVRGDASALPFVPDSFDGVLCVNMFLFPDQVDRVLRSRGHLLWVNTMGDQTPIHLPVEDVVAALPGEWTATTSRAGSGIWGVVARW
ncbi:MAG: class I SAM-dependent methyltransferase [Acidimicrobiales bacterium]